jgi:hypothetical protein
MLWKSIQLLVRVQISSNQDCRFRSVRCRLMADVDQRPLLWPLSTNMPILIRTRIKTNPHLSINPSTNRNMRLNTTISVVIRSQHSRRIRCNPCMCRIWRSRWRMAGWTSRRGRSMRSS